MVIIWSYFQEVSIFGLLIIIVSCIIVIWHIKICIQFLFYIWEFLLFFFFFFSYPITKFLYIGSCFLFLQLIIFLIFLSLCASLVYSGNAIQVCPIYHRLGFSIKLPLFYWKTSFLSSGVYTDLYYVLFTMFTSKPSSLLPGLAFSAYCLFTEVNYFIPIWEWESPEMSSCIQIILF